MRGLNKAESVVLRDIALCHGYTVTRGPTAKNGAEAGNPIELLLAVISGEVATVLLDSDERWQIIAELERHAAALDGWLSEGIRKVASQLRAAAEREHQLDAEELADYLPDD